jgi:hypothetical protein
MNYPAFTNDSFTIMYEGIRGARAANNDLKTKSPETGFRVRETPDWKRHAGELESGCFKRGMFLTSSTGRKSRKIRRRYPSKSEATPG